MSVLYLACVLAVGLIGAVATRYWRREAMDARRTAQELYAVSDAMHLHIKDLERRIEVTQWAAEPDPNRDRHRAFVQH